MARPQRLPHSPDVIFSGATLQGTERPPPCPALSPHLSLWGLWAAHRPGGAGWEEGAAGSHLPPRAQDQQAAYQQPTLRPLLKLDRDKRTGRHCQLEKAGPAPTPPPMPAWLAQPSSKITRVSPSRIQFHPRPCGRQRADARGHSQGGGTNACVLSNDEGQGSQPGMRDPVSSAVMPAGGQRPGTGNTPMSSAVMWARSHSQGRGNPVSSAGMEARVACVISSDAGRGLQPGTGVPLSLAVMQAGDHSQGWGDPVSSAVMLARGHSWPAPLTSNQHPGVWGRKEPGGPRKALGGRQGTIPRGVQDRS